MKKTLLILLACLPLVFSGCGTTPQAKLTQAEATTVNTVDASMQAWAEWVKAGNTTQAQVDKVHAAYNYYYPAQLASKAALEKYVASKTPEDAAASAAAQSALVAAETSLVSLIGQFMAITPK